MKKFLALLIVASFVLLSGCKKGGGGGPSVTLPSQNLTGTYKLTGFEITGGGQTFTDENVSGEWSGEMKIALDEFYQLVEFGDYAFLSEGFFTLTWENPQHTSATLDIYNEWGVFQGQVFLEIAGYEVSVFLIVAHNGTLYSEEDVWQKVSDQV